MTGCRSCLDRHWGWVVTAASFVMYLVSCGTLGLFVLLYVYFEREFHGSAAAIGWIGSLGNGLLNLMSLVSSPLYERFGHRRIILLGVVLSSAGILASSFTQALWQNYLTFGILFATGLNFLSNPSVNMMTLYFPGRNCARATALGSSGQSIGTLLLTPLFEALFSGIGWRRSLQVLSVVNFLTCVPLAMVFRPPGPRPVKFDGEAASSPDEKDALNMTEVGNAPGPLAENRDGESHPRTDGQANCQPPSRLAAANPVRENEDSLQREFSVRKGPSDDSDLSAERTTALVPSSGAQPPTHQEAVGDGVVPEESAVLTPNDRVWRKYIDLAKDPRHACYFIGTIGVTVTIVFNAVNLVSCMTVGGIPEPTAAWLITLLYVTDVVVRLGLSLMGGRLPRKIVLLSLASGVGAVGAFLLTRGTSLWIFVVYSVVAGFLRGTIFGLGYSCVVELFGANKAVESLTSLQIAYGIGGLLASSVAGLSYDLTGTYQTTHYTCLGIWLLSGFLYVVVYQWRRVSASWCKSHQHI
ncbi:monocarboxylate transporter 7-like [Acanthaster planci]|uniref:Monocarboxylate transporter 7-like n=1 Tax=Acanthaster planci TaxID=133434 RepID=A0A8B7YJM3_ACAPL|nr:monocarboxylate transporter 7-like [Acanthaster planci]